MSDKKEQSKQEKAIELSPEDGQKIVDFINEKSLEENDACKVCGSKENAVANYQSSLPVSGKDGGYLGSNLELPVYTTVCNNCGYVRMFSKFVVNSKIGVNS